MGDRKAEESVARSNIGPNGRRPRRRPRPPAIEPASASAGDREGELDPDRIVVRDRSSPGMAVPPRRTASVSFRKHSRKSGESMKVLAPGNAPAMRIRNKLRVGVEFKLVAVLDQESEDGEIVARMRTPRGDAWQAAAALIDRSWPPPKCEKSPSSIAARAFRCVGRNRWCRRRVRGRVVGWT